MSGLSLLIVLLLGKSKSSVICIKHFEERFIINGKSRKSLNMKLNPVPSIHSEEVCTTLIHRKLPKKRDFSIDEMQDVKENDTKSSFEELNEKHVLYYNLQFDEKNVISQLGWIKNFMFSYYLVEIHYLYLIDLYVELMQNCVDLECE